MSLNRISLAGALVLGGLTLPLVSSAQFRLGLDITNTSETSIDVVDFISVLPPIGAGRPTIEASTDREVVCLDRNGSANGTFDLRLIDINGRFVESNNVVSAGFAPDTLAATLGVTTQCFTLPTSVDQPLVDAQQDVCAGVVADAIFVSGFEQETVGDGVTLAVGVRVLQQATVLGDPLRYEISTKNCSAVNATNVKVRDFFYAEQSGEAARLEYDASGFWKPCGENGPCNPNVNGGYAEVNFGNLGAGVTKRITAERFLADPGQVNGNTDAAVIGAFASNGQAFATSRVDIVVTANEPPAIVADTTPVVLSEDASSQAIADFAVDDSDGMVASVQVVSTNTALLTITQQPVEGPVGTWSGGGYIPVANASGAAAVRIVAIDNEDAIAMTDIPVTINPVNDPPTLSVGEGFTVPGADLSGPAAPVAYCVADQTTVGASGDLLGCNIEQVLEEGFVRAISLERFLTDVSPGAGESEVPTVALLGAAPTGFFGGNVLPELVVNASDPTAYDLIYSVQGLANSANLVIRVNDGGSPQEQLDVNFRITVGPLP